MSSQVFKGFQNHEIYSGTKSRQFHLSYVQNVRLKSVLYYTTILIQYSYTRLPKYKTIELTGVSLGFIETKGHTVFVKINTREKFHVLTLHSSIHSAQQGLNQNESVLSYSKMTYVVMCKIVVRVKKGILKLMKD